VHCGSATWAVTIRKRGNEFLASAQTDLGRCPAFPDIVIVNQLCGIIGEPHAVRERRWIASILPVSHGS
jgi:hypothetical protein